MRWLTALVVLWAAGFASGQTGDAKEAEIKMLRNSVKRQAEEMEPLRAKVREQDRQIESLKSQLVEREKALADLRAKVDELAKQMEQAKAEHEAALAKIVGEKNGREGPLKAIPVVGDEVSPTKLSADAASWLGKPFVMVGGMELANYYNFRFDGAADDLYSLSLVPLAADLRPNGDRIHAYALKRKFKPLIDELAKRQDKGTGMLVRVKLVISARCLDGGQWHEQAELVDWQVMKDRTSWGPWEAERK